MKVIHADLQRERYDFPEGMLRLVNWREVEPDPPGRWPGIYGDPETELIICRETMGSKQTVMGRSVYKPGSYHDILVFKRCVAISQANSRRNFS